MALGQFAVLEIVNPFIQRVLYMVFKFTDIYDIA
jgi:hypothetical protein